MQDAPTPRSKAPKPIPAVPAADVPTALPQPGSHSLQELFQECKAENSLLGKLLQESQAQSKVLEKQLQQERKKCGKATQAAKDAELRAKEARAQAERGMNKRLLNIDFVHASRCRDSAAGIGQLETAQCRRC